MPHATAALLFACPHATAAPPPAGIKLVFVPMQNTPSPPTAVQKKVMAQGVELSTLSIGRDSEIPNHLGCMSYWLAITR